jgi:hypothetical protein
MLDRRLCVLVLPLRRIANVRALHAELHDLVDNLSEKVRLFAGYQANKRAVVRSAELVLIPCTC